MYYSKLWFYSINYITQTIVTVDNQGNYVTMYVAVPCGNGFTCMYSLIY